MSLCVCIRLCVCVCVCVCAACEGRAPVRAERGDRVRPVLPGNIPKALSHFPCRNSPPVTHTHTYTNTETQRNTQSLPHTQTCSDINTCKTHTKTLTGRHTCKANPGSYRQTYSLCRVFFPHLIWKWVDLLCSGKREHSNFERGRVPEGLRQIRRTDSTESVSQPASVVCLTRIFGTSVACFECLLTKMRT